MALVLDKYARDYALWRDFAAIDYTAAIRLFDTKDPFMFPSISPR